MLDLLIVGGGVLGAFLAREFSFYEGSCLVLEKENDVCNGASGANSGIVHSGYDPKPGTLKAKYNKLGREMFPSLCKELGIPFIQRGSLTVALKEQGTETLYELLERAKQNCVEARIVEGEELRAMEPNLSEDAVAALYCPDAGIVDPFLLTARAMEDAIDNGVELHLDEEALSIAYEDGRYIVKTSLGEYEARTVVVAAGAYTEKIIKTIGMEGYGSYLKKGNYYVLEKTAKPVSRTVFPLPSQKGKGILITPTTMGAYLVGPDAVEHGDLDDVGTELNSLEAIMEGARKLVPMVSPSMGIRVYAGNRSSCWGGDFIIGEKEDLPGFVYLGGIDSPGLTAAPALAKDVIRNKIAPYLSLKPNDISKRIRTDYVYPNSLPKEERDALFARDGRYAHILCSCEKVSLGEVEDVLHSSLPCLSVKALKKRTGAGFGKCQGGFCMASVLPYLSESMGISEGEVPYDRPGSQISMKEIRDGD